ncbi:LLM class flavin-dependent oxidoreductase [Natronorubrum sp. FCH18a]|uniref:LLM class flavin-dependent oxidoreductase n=1 Tax=Natronorubrum sp. FCH18a TaxID=3447018 RepID=UPI003F5143C5
MTSFGYLLPTRGIVLSSDDDATLASKTQTDVINMGVQAETLGFESVWAGDSVLARPRLEPLTTLAAVAAATDTIGLGTAVYLPALRNPANVAHLTATVDQLSGGRLSFGVGAGASRSDVEAEHANLDAPFEDRGEAINELLSIVTELWSGETVTHDGSFYQLEGASLGFGPVRSPTVYVPTGAFDPDRGFPKTIRERLIEHGDGCLPNVVSPDEYRASLDAIEELLETAGRDPATFDPALYMDVVVDDSEDAARQQAREFYDQYYGKGVITDEQLATRGLYGPLDHVEAELGAYADAGVETMVVRFTAREQRAQLRQFASTL